MRGVYILFLRALDDVRMRVGGLGEIELEKGLYAYIGSAQNNLEKRVARHRSKAKKPQWHIDYLTASDKVVVEGACAYELPREYECKMAEFLARISQKPVRRFGSSDCRCPGHLFKITGTIEDVCEKVSKVFGSRPRRIF
jgi:Uri superfamily endonuclease